MKALEKNMPCWIIDNGSSNGEGDERLGSYGDYWGFSEVHNMGVYSGVPIKTHPRPISPFWEHCSRPSPI